MLYRLSYAPGTENRILPQAIKEPQRGVVRTESRFAMTGLVLFELSEQRRQPTDARQQQSNETQDRQNEGNEVHIGVLLLAGQARRASKSVERAKFKAATRSRIW